MPLERRALIGMCALIAVNQLGFGGIVPSLPLYAQSFGVSASAIGLAIATYGLARFAVAIPSGQLAERLGRRPTLALGGFTSALGNLGCALALSYPQFILARFVSGAGAGMILSAGLVVLADITTPERRGRVIAIYQGTFIFAVGIGPLPGGLLAEHFGLAAPFGAYAVASALAGVVAWFAVPETREQGWRGALRSSLPSFGRQIQLLGRQLGFVLVSLIGLMNAVVRTGGLFTIIPILAAQRFGLSVAQIGLGLAAGSVLGLLATYPAGVVVDRFGRKAVIVPATLISGTAMLLFCMNPVLVPPFGWYLVGCITWGTAMSVGGAAPAAYAADSAPPGMNAAAMSTFRMVGDIGYVAGPLVLGAIVDWRGPETALTVGATALALVGLLFARLARETHRAGARSR